MALKGGHVASFADSMAEAIETAMNEEWQAVKGEALSTDDQESRRLLFCAIARGVLGYLKSHEADLIKTIGLDGGSGAVSNTVSALELDIDASA